MNPLRPFPGAGMRSKIRAGILTLTVVAGLVILNSITKKLKTCQVTSHLGRVLIWRGARVVLSPQRLDGADMLRVGTTRAPLASLKFKLGHYQTVDGNFYCRLCKVTFADSSPGAVAFKVMLPGTVPACRIASPRP